MGQASFDVRHARPSMARSKHPSIDNQVEYLAKYLQLDQQQKSTIRNILVQRQQETLQMRRSPSKNAGNPTDRFVAIEDRTAERIRGALNEEQRKKYDPFGNRSRSVEAQQTNVEDWLEPRRLGEK